jgi:hypothetical protein
MDPRLNAQKIIENCILLTDHLNQRELRCSDCITKHFASLSAYSSELLGLCKSDADKKEFAFAVELPKFFRILFELWKHKKMTPQEVACRLRSLRKELMYRYWKSAENSEWSGVHAFVNVASLPEIKFPPMPKTQA